MKEFKYKAVFASKINPLVSEEADKYISLAAKNNFSKYLPKEINIEEKIDFLPFAAEGFIANKLNLNHDGVTTEEALRIADLVPFSILDSEHNRSAAIGTIVKASFAEVGTGKELTRDEVKDLKTPFAVIIAGVIWRLVNQEIADEIESSASSNSLSDKYFLSWELLFSDLDLISIDANKTNFEDGEIISDKDKVEELEEKIKANGGKRLLEGKKIGRIAKQSIPAGFGIVEHPAGQLQPIALANSTENTNKTEEKANIEELKKELNNTIVSTVKEQIDILEAKNIKNNANNISHSAEVVVKQSRNMKIKDIKDITNESLKEMQASDIETFVNEKLQEAANTLSKEKKDKEAAEIKVKELEATQKANSEQIEKLNKEVNQFKEEKEIAAKKEKFNQRMAYFDDTYELDADYTKLIATDLNDISDEAFDGYKKKMELLLKDKNKEVIKAAKAKLEEKKEAKANLDEKEIEKELDKTKEEKSKLPNSAPAATPTLREKAQAAFGKDSYIVKTR